MHIQSPLFAIHLIALTAAASAQTGSVAVSSEKYVTYVDGSFGFQISIPAAWRLDRARFTTKDGAIGVSQAASPDTFCSLQVAVYRYDEPPAFADWVERFANRIRAAEGTARMRGEQRKAPAGDGYQFIVEGTSAGPMTIRRHFCIPLDPSTIWVLTFASIHDNPEVHDTATREYDNAIASLKITYTAATKEAMNAALTRGKGITDNLATLGPKYEFDVGVHYYITEGESGPTGYFRSQVDRTTKDRKPGLRLRERGWQFSPDQTATMTRTDAFSSFDGKTEFIETETAIVAPAARSNTPDKGISIALDQCVREGDALFSSFSMSRRPTEQESRSPIKIGPVYLPFVWTRLLPTLAGEKPGEPLGFVVYDPQIRGLATRLVRCVGDRPLATENKTYRAYDITEGYAPQPTTLLCEPNGVLHQFAAGGVTVRTATAEEVDRLFKARRDEAEKRLRR